MDKDIAKLTETFGATLGGIIARCAKMQQQRKNNHHLQLSGMAHYDDKGKFLYTPDTPIPGCRTPFRSVGVAQLLSDGTFDFIRKPRLRAQSELIRKLAHGRASKTKDGAIQLTLKVYQDEGVNISQTIEEEAIIAAKAIAGWQLKR